MQPLEYRYNTSANLHWFALCQLLKKYLCRMKCVKVKNITRNLEIFNGTIVFFNRFFLFENKTRNNDVDVQYYRQLDTTSYNIGRITLQTVHRKLRNKLEHKKVFYESELN